MKKNKAINGGIIIFFVSVLFSLILNHYYNTKIPQSVLEFVLIMIGICGICTGVVLCFKGITEINNETNE
jgi:polyferredoxin